MVMPIGAEGVLVSGDLGSVQEALSDQFACGPKLMPACVRGHANRRPGFFGIVCFGFSLEGN